MSNDNNNQGNGSTEKPIVIPIVPPTDRTSLSEGVIPKIDIKIDKK